MKADRRARILATLGPASSTLEQIRALAQAGANVFRLNFSHGSHEDHAERHRLIRQVEQELGHPIGILMDLQGPKLRVGRIAGGKAVLAAGQSFRLDLDPAEGDARRAQLPHPEIFAALEVGTAVVQAALDDGRGLLRIGGQLCGKLGFDARAFIQLDQPFLQRLIHGRPPYLPAWAAKRGPRLPWP